MPEQHNDYRPHPIITELAILAELEEKTQVELAKEDGVSPETWRSWLTGRRAPSLDRLAQRAATLRRKIVLVPIDPERIDEP